MPIILYATTPKDGLPAIEWHKDSLIDEDEESGKQDCAMRGTDRAGNKYTGMARFRGGEIEDGYVWDIELV